MTKPSKNAKKLQKKLNGNNTSQTSKKLAELTTSETKDTEDTEKKNQEKKTQQFINENHFELFSKFTQPEHIDITKLLTESPNKSEETETLEKTTAQFITQEESENIVQNQYTGGEDYTKYNKHEHIDITKYPIKDKQLKQYKTELLSFNPVTTDSESNSPESDYNTKKPKEQHY